MATPKPADCAPRPATTAPRRPARFPLGVLVGLVVGVLVTGATGPCSRTTTTDVGAMAKDEFLDETIVAKVGNYTITARDLDDRIRFQFPDLADAFSAANERSIREVLGLDIEHLVLVSEAERSGYADSSYRYYQAAELSRRFQLQTLYTQEVIHKLAEPDEERVRAEYDNMRQSFTTPRRSAVRHIEVATRAEAEAARARIEAGEAFADVAMELTLHEGSRVSGGAIGWVERGKPIKGLGRNDAFLDAALALQVGEMDIVQSPRGWHLITVIRLEEAGYLPYEEVRDQIFERLHNQSASAVFDSTLRALRVRFDATLYDESLAAYLAWRRREPEEELFTRAQDEADPLRKIEIYQEHIERFPHSDHACESKFMIAFTYAEELHDRHKARLALNEFMGGCEDHELAESARFLLDELSRAGK